MALTKEDAEVYCLELGKFTAGWAHVEWGLSAWVSVVHVHYPYDGMDSDPIALGRRIKFLKLAYKSRGDLKSFHDPVIATLSEVKTISNDRNLLMKGVINVNLSDSQNFLIRKLDRKLTAHKYDGIIHDERSLTLSHLIEMRKAVFRLTGEIADHAIAIHPG